MSADHSTALEIFLLYRKNILVEFVFFICYYNLSLLQNFAVELTLESLAELDHDAFTQELIKAGGANYGTGVRE